MLIELSQEQLVLVREMLERRHQEIGPEIHRTDHREYKAMLSQEERMLEEILKIVAPESLAA